MQKDNNHTDAFCQSRTRTDSGPDPVGYTVALLFDRDNDWIYHEIQRCRCFDAMGTQYTFSTHFDHQSVRNQDIVFVLGYTKILKSDFLSSNKLTLVVHESDLPKGKGFSPVQWQILEGHNEIPVCLIRATEDLDAGDIIEKDVIHLKGHELFEDIRRKQAEATLALMERFLMRYPHITAMPQIGPETVYRRRTRRDDRLDVNRSIAGQFNVLRIADNERYPAFFELNGHTYYLKIYRDPS